MARSILRGFLLVAFLPIGACGQSVENYFLFGASFGGSQVLGGSNVTINAGTGFSNVVGFAFEVGRESAASLWIEPFPVILDVLSETSSVPGSPSPGSMLFVPSARLMIPVHSRISVFAALGGGVGYFRNLTLSSDNPPQLKTNHVYHAVVGAGGGVDFRIVRRLSIRVDARDYVTGRDSGGVVGRHHFLPMVGIALHY
jgi:hypothetical protein